MKETISKGRMFAVTTAVNDDLLARMKDAPNLAARAQQAGAEYWHSGILPIHFKQGASIIYGYAARTATYLKARAKRGKPTLVFSGSMRRDLAARASFKIAAGGSVELKLTARILNLVPNMQQDNPDDYVKHKKGRGYPNLKKEIKAMTDADRENVAIVVTAVLERSFDTGINQIAQRYGVRAGDVA